MWKSEKTSKFRSTIFFFEPARNYASLDAKRIKLIFSTFLAPF